MTQKASKGGKGRGDHRPTQADSVVGALARKLKEADNKQPLRLGASVSQECEKALQKIAAAVVEEHFPSHKTGKCHNGVQALVVTFSIDWSQADSYSVGYPTANDRKWEG